MILILPLLFGCFNNEKKITAKEIEKIQLSISYIQTDGKKIDLREEVYVKEGGSLLLEMTNVPDTLQGNLLIDERSEMKLIAGSSKEYSFKI